MFRHLKTTLECDRRKNKQTDRQTDRQNCTLHSFAGDKAQTLLQEDCTKSNETKAW